MRAAQNSDVHLHMSLKAIICEVANVKNFESLPIVIFTLEMTIAYRNGDMNSFCIITGDRVLTSTIHSYLCGIYLLKSSI